MKPGNAPGLFQLVTAAFCFYLALALAYENPDHDDHIVNRRSVSLNLDYNPDFAPNGPLAYARALRKWGAEVPGELTDVLVKMQGDEDYPVAVTNATSIRNDREYVSTIGFGTPQQRLNVDFDTGSADVWVYTSETRKSVIGDRPVFVLENSTTLNRVENATWMITYGDGSRAWGNVYTDNIDLHGVTIHDAVIESAISASASLTEDPDIDGIFGLAYKLPSQTDPGQPSVLSVLTQQLYQPVFTADLRYHSSQGGWTFGFVDFARYLNGTIHWIPLVPNATFWQFEYTGINVATTPLWLLPQPPHTAIADSGTTLLLLPPQLVAHYYTSTPAIAASAHRNTTLGGIWTFPCASASALPPFSVGFATGFVVTIPGVFFNYTVMRDDPRMCMGGMQEFDGVIDTSGDGGIQGPEEGQGGRVAIFGDIFLKAVYAVFDVGGGRIGFGEKRLELEPVA